MKKVLIVFPSTKIGGAERVMRNVAQELSSRGWGVYLVGLTGSTTDHWAEMELLENVIAVRLGAGRELTSLSSLTRYIHQLSRTQNLDLVFSSHAHINGFLSLLRKTRILKCRRYVARESTFIMERYVGLKRLYFRALYKLCYGGHDALICQTTGMMESLRSNLGALPCSRCVILSNPVQSNNMESDESLGESGTAHRPFIVACGRLETVKGFDILIRSFADIIDKGYKGNLVILGEGRIRSELAELVRSLKLGQRVFMPGHVVSPHVWFSAASLGVVSSRVEGFPNVLLEMMSSGIPRIVSTPCTDGVFGMPGVDVASEVSSEALGESLISALAGEENLSGVYRATIKKKHSLSHFVDKLLNS